MAKRVTIVVFLMFLLAACQSPPAAPTPIGPVTRPDLVTLINWERSPLAVVFRAEAADIDTAAFGSRSEIADCTIYGDNRVVYSTPDGIGKGIAWQRVSDEAIRVFVEDLTLSFQIYNQRTGLDALALELRPEQTETLTLVVNGQAHRADALGGWPQDYYRSVTERCRAVADAPAELLPTGAYVSAETIPYNDNMPSTDWNAANGIDLSTLSAERYWYVGGAVQALWAVQRDLGADVQIRQGDRIFRVAVEVPGVSRYAPPPP